MLVELDVHQRLVLVRYSAFDSQTQHAQHLFVCPVNTDTVIELNDRPMDLSIYPFI